jgi:kumamolisin
MSFVPLAGSERYKFEGSKAVGLADPRELLEISLRIRRKSTLPEVDNFGLPGGSAIRLQPEDLEKNYGADPADVAKVESFAKANGLTVSAVDAGARSIHLTGTSEQFAQAFEVKLVRYEYAGGNFRGRLGPVHIPAELEGIILGVFGLDSRPQAKKRGQVLPVPATTSHAVPTRPWFTPPELGKLYEFPEADGSGQTIGILAFGGGFDPADLATYFQTLKIPNPTVVAVNVGSAKNNPNEDASSDSEVMLDIEVAGALAPKAKLVVYFSNFTEKGWVDAIAKAVHDKKHRLSVLCISWGFAEGKLIWTESAIDRVNETLHEAALLGITVCVASGDDGSSDGADDGHAHVDFPGSSPYVLSVGGTTLQTANGAISREEVWNGGPRQTAGGAGGGGVSSVNPTPTWQKSLAPASVNPGHKKGRGVPDVAANADPKTGYFVRSGGNNGVGGGTSAAAPLWAALIALLNQKLGKPVGFLNPRLYQILGPAKVLQDVAHGNNDTQGLVGGYSAKAGGWDNCTGWGTPHGKKLLAALST